MHSLAARICAGALSAVVLFASSSAGKRAPAGPPSAAPTAQAPGMSFHVEVFARENSSRLSSLASEECALVRRVLEAPLAKLSDPSQAIDVVDGALQKAFVGRVHMDPDVVRYKAVWCPEIQAFKIKCCVSAVFEVMLENPILVPVEIGTQL